MKRNFEDIPPTELEILCQYVRELVLEEKYVDCMPEICRAMGKYPHAPEPHNLIGIVLEKMGDHLTAMKHFRAAWALDPTYLPASHNLKTYGTFFSDGGCAFDKSDIPNTPQKSIEVIYDDRDTGPEIQYDESGAVYTERR